MPEQPPKSSRRSSPATPSDFPVQSPPQPLPGADYSYTVELVGSIQHQLGKLTQAVETLTDKTKGQGEKLDQSCRDLHVAKVILAIVGGIATIALTFLAVAFKAYLDHAWPTPK